MTKDSPGQNQNQNQTRGGGRAHLTRMVFTGGAVSDSCGILVQVFKDHLLPLDEQLTDATWTAAK